SRSAFALAFKELVGESPARYLTGRRLEEAARLLDDSDIPQRALPAKVGYQSAVGFHLAFRKRFGVTPGEYRNRRRTATPVGWPPPPTAASARRVRTDA